MLVDLFAKNKSMPFFSCALLFCIFCVFADSEYLLLAAMVFDRYKAVSSLLLHTVNMSSRLCSLLLSEVYLVEMVDALIHSTLTFCLCFCGSNEMNHFFCGVPPLLLLSCSYTQVNELVIFTIFAFIELSAIIGVLISYYYITLLVLKMHSVEGRAKAFFTCTSHLNALTVLQGTLFFVFFQPSSSYSPDQDKMTSLYTLVIPMLDPLIYSLWNKDVKEALQKLKNKICF